MVLSAFLLLCLPVLCGATDVGNVTSWFSNSLGELTFTCQTLSRLCRRIYRAGVLTPAGGTASCWMDT